jgi:hypothetical protein
MTIKEQILRRYNTVRAFTQYCEEKYGVRALTMASEISRGQLTKRMKHILIEEGINLSGENVKPHKDPNIEYAKYMSNISKQIKNWRAGL